MSYKKETVYTEYGISRQSHYQRKKRRTEEKYNVEIVVRLVKEKRKRMPKIGVKKLHYMLKQDFDKLGYKIGRDKLYEILRENKLLVVKKKRKVKTTNSRHHFYLHSNLIKELKLERKDQVLVGDITYIRTDKNFVYLSLLTDLYTRKIVGYSVSHSLSVELNLESLKMALKTVKAPQGLIHHSDRGVQYCCHLYTNKLKENGIKISMGEAGNPYDNAVAERLNGILKDEFMLYRIFKDINIARATISEAVKIYNNERPHLALKMLTPSEKHSIKDVA